MNTRQCPFSGCKTMIAPEKFACFPHWQKLTAGQKARIWEAYNAWKAGTLDAEGLRNAQAEVIQAVESWFPPVAAEPAAKHYPGTTPGTCSGCHAAILWATTVNGKQIPLDPEPTPAGNVSVTPGGAKLLPKDTLAHARAANARLFMPHHATCPQAARYKRKK